MNQALIIDEPKGAGWRFSLDGTAPLTAYQDSRTFTQDAAGAPFVDGKDYLLFAHHQATGERLTDSVTFWAAPVDYLLRPDSELPDLAQVARRGAITGRTLRVGGLGSAAWPRLKAASELFVGLPLSDGTIDLALITLADLAASVAPYLNLGEVDALPAYVPVRIYRWVIDQTTDILPAYVPVRIWRFVIDQALTRPNAPTNLNLINDGGRYKLSFTDNADNEASFRVVRSLANGSFEPYISIPANETLSGYLPDIDGVSVYHLKVQAVNAAGESAWSNTVALFPPSAVPQLPTILLMYCAVVQGPGPQHTLVLRPALSMPGEVEWKWVNAQGATLSDWTTYGNAPQWEASDYTLYFDTGVPEGTLQRMLCRPKANPSAVKGPYPASYGGTQTRLWQELNPTS